MLYKLCILIVLSFFSLSLSPPAPVLLVVDVMFHPCSLDIYGGYGDYWIRDTEKLKILLENKNENHLELESYTDKYNTWCDNLDIAKKRADIIKNILIKNGIDKEKIIIKIIGPTDLFAKGDSIDPRILNNRIHFILPP